MRRITAKRTASRARRAFCAFSAGGAILALSSGDANAQQTTFHLDRLEVPGAPDDGLILFRPVTQKRATFYAQLALGLSVNPLRSANITQDAATLRVSPRNAVTSQFLSYLSAGFELFDSLIVGATFPVTWEQSGSVPTPPSVGGNPFASGTGHTSYSLAAPAAGDTRIDARYTVLHSDDRTAAFGAQFSVWAPTGGGSSTNFGGDSGLRVMPMLTGEWRPVVKFPWPILVANTGIDVRPETAINDPGGRNGPRSGLGIGSEWRWAVGALLPIADDKYRVGATVFGQTGLQGSGNRTTGGTSFSPQNTPIEWNIEGRMRVPYAIAGDRWYAGVAAGSRILDGYGAPDFRVVALVGMYIPIEDTTARSPDLRAKLKVQIQHSMKDTDGDGIPDDIDACPEEPEDHKDPDPMDGCPQPSDRDGDGIPDQLDKCPDVPEDKDGIDDQDGCPEDDADQDGIPDAKDACPKEPGQPSPDPKKNGCPRFIKLEGSSVRVLQQVHFQTGSATILPDSFPMLGEIAALLKATPGIKKMRIEGHTDNRGNAAMNLDLSKRRAASVRQWLIDHGIASGRLESEGYGLTQPIESNDTDEGRAANRRVEFKIIDEDSSSGKPPSSTTKPAGE
jgi:outer membrane protein OmpA-like peptidoglycan-associated protein